MNNIDIVIPKNINNLNDLKIEANLISPFDSILIEFVDDVSKSIFKYPLIKNFPELMALAFWMRKSHIKQLEEHFKIISQNKIMLGRGIVFHIAPSNVDTIFIYSWFISLLVGNSNILRISEKENMQTNLLLELINNVLENENYLRIRDKIAVIRYGHIDEITKKMSIVSDVRIIWGGDNTVNHIRQIPIKPTSIELTFANKFSLCVINSKEFLNSQEEEIDKIIKSFYNDSYIFGQMACSSIRLVSWIGDKEDNSYSKEIFWNKLEKYFQSNKPEDIMAVDIVNKIVAECSMAIESNVKITHLKSPYINKVAINSLKEIKEELHCGSGLFYEYETDKFENILPFMNRKYQTISQFGFKRDELVKIICSNLPNGIDRIVPIGEAMNFSNIWDGYDLLKSLTREIEIL